MASYFLCAAEISYRLQPHHYMLLKPNHFTFDRCGSLLILKESNYMVILLRNVYHETLLLRKLDINGLTSLKHPPRPDTIWLSNIPFALTLALLSHALQIMGAVYYLCFKTFEGTGVGYCRNVSVKSTNMSKLGLQWSNQVMAEGAQIRCWTG